MISLHSLMLVVLGVLLATLVVIAVAPAYRRRVMRLTTERIRQSLPVTEAEIRADKDRLRAQYAIRVHKLEAQSEQQKLSVARQRIEMNRRDARITELESELEKAREALEENVNARRVLEHTVTDRLPRLEQQLESARGLISSRDNEMAMLKSETTRSVRALDDALQMNAQQRGEIERMSATLASRAPMARDAAGISQFDGEMALRSEIEALRARTRDQAQAIARLQIAAQEAAGNPAGAAGVDVERLKRELAETESSLRSAREQAHSGGFDRAAAEAQAKSLNARIDEQAAEIARLSAALAAWEGSEEAASGGDRRALGRDGRNASKARISSLQAQIATQNDTIQKLRAELAASNERLARQAAHFMEEMRRLGTGAGPASIEPRRQQAAPRRTLSDRISQNQGKAPPAEQPAARGSEAAERAAPAPAPAPAAGAKVSDYVRALADAAPVIAASSAATHATGPATTEPHGQGGERELALAGAAQEAAHASNGAEKPAPRRPRLLERISGLGKA